MIEKRKLVIILVFASAVAMASLCIASFLKLNMLNKQLKQTQLLVTKMEDESRRLKAEREKVTSDNEKLQADAVSYLGINTELQKEKDSLLEKTKTAQKLIESKEAELQRVKKILEKIDLKKSKAQKEQLEKLNIERDEALAKLSELEATLKKERGLYHYNLAVAYSQAKFLDEALASYEKAIFYDPDNADAHYNLGVMYSNYKDDPAKAIEQYRQYLRLKPQADDREEVLAAIQKLGQ